QTAIDVPSAMALVDQLAGFTKRVRAVEVADEDGVRDELRSIPVVQLERRRFHDETFQAIRSDFEGPPMRRTGARAGNRSRKTRRDRPMQVPGDHAFDVRVSGNDLRQ